MKLRSWRVTLAGGGAIDEFRKLADDLGILDKLCFLGWLDQVGVSALCADADVLVLPSHAEGLAMSVLEGLSHGLAVVTTPVGAHSEVIEPGVSGILVPPGDVAALAGALASVIENATLRHRLARGARDRFLEGFDVRRYAARLEQLHASLLASQHDQSEAVGKGQTFVKHSSDQSESSQQMAPRVNVLGVSRYADEPHTSHRDTGKMTR
jgi:glycosyltransferase involved in cell wall biosynthesis